MYKAFIHPLGTRSLAFRLNAIVIVSMFIALSSIGVTLFLSWQLEGSAAAINDAGSLRMRTYHLGLLLEEHLQQRQSLSIINQEITLINSTLTDLQRGDPSRPLALPRTIPVAQQLVVVNQQWQQQLRPAVEQLLNASSPQQHILLQQTRPLLDSYVAQIQQLVTLIEANNASNTLTLRFLQMLLIFMALVGTIAFAYSLFLMIIRPLLRLNEGMARMSAKDFSVKLTIESQDEFGELANGFNSMAEELKDLYITLEQRVADKTEKLAQQNHELGLLYENSAMLQETNEDIEGLCRGFLERVMRFFQADGGSVRIRGDANRRVFMVVHAGISQKLIATESVLDSDMGFCGEVLCDKTAISETVATIEAQHPECGQCTEEGFKVVSAFQIQAHGKVLGFFNLQFRQERIFTSTEKRLIDTLGQHLGVAIEAQDIKNREREMAIFQERNLVAQGLHDSIAQGLNFLNLQVQMMEDSLARQDMAQVHDIVPLLRAGVQESYEDVRELLNNFRVKLGSLDLAEALKMTIEKFQRQTQIPVNFVQQGQGHLRSAEQQLQIVFILQEALSNIRKHAHAQQVTVTLSNDHDLALTITDDGIGFDLNQVASEKEGHVGLNIMRERAARLGGLLTFDAQQGKGTRLKLTIANISPAAAFA